MKDDDRLPFAQAVGEALRLRQGGMDWRDIGLQLGYGHNRLRNAVKAGSARALDLDGGGRCASPGFASLMSASEK